MDEKKQFLQEFKRTVKNEGGNLSNSYILERINRGDISESDISTFKRYIPLQLAIAIDGIMEIRKTTGILKSAKEIYDKKRIKENTPVKVILEMIKDIDITQDDIQKFIKFTENDDIKKQLSKQIDRFFKEVLKYPSLSNEEKNKQKFKIEKMLRKKIVTLTFLDRKANVKDIVKSIFKDEYKRYLTEEPYEKEIKEAIDRGFIKDSNIQYLPEEYIDYYLKISPGGDKTSFKKRRKTSNSSYVQNLTKKEAEEFIKDIVGRQQYKKKKSDVAMKDVTMFDDQELLNVIKTLESKGDTSTVTKKLESLNLMTKSKRTKQKGSLQQIKSKYIKQTKSQQKANEEFLGLIQKEPVVKSLYSVERKLEDLKKGKKSKYLSRADKTLLSQELSKTLGQKTVKTKKMKEDKNTLATSPVSSRSSSSRSSISSLFNTKDSSVGSPSSSRSSVSSTKSEYKPEKEIKPKEIPSLIKLASVADSELDPGTVKVLSTFVNNSIAYSIGKKQKKDKAKIKIDAKKLLKYVESEKQREEKYIKNKKRKKSISPPLSPYIPSKISD